MIYDDVYDKLVADATIVAALSTYAGLPAVITSPLEPSDIECPYILIEHVGGGPAAKAEPRCLRGWVEIINVRVVDDREQTSGVLNAISHAVFLALDRTAVDSAYGNGWLTCSGPQAYLDGDGFPGALIVVTADLWI